ncbi:MAG: hypothetical protein HQL38_18425, partial [Alphaproteobacteria bacterium]|nr:hypothetical protein [Alphaproteobacteria bacterium]
MGGDPRPVRPPARRAGGGGLRIDAAAFEALVAELLRKGGGGGHLARIHLISLDSVASAFGDRWPKLAEKARAIVGSLIAARLGRSDAWLRVGDSFLVLLAGVSQIEASIKIAALADEIGRRLLGEEGDQARQIVVAHRVVPLADLGRLGPAPPAGRLAAAL